ncbi:MAG: protein kinase [Polyangiaceae bacterium]
MRRIASGGMGAIYEVMHVETQARSALKVLLPNFAHNDEMRGRFRQEALVTAKIQSDHIARVFDGGTDSESGAPFIVLELLAGRDLGAELEARRRLPFDEVCLIAKQVGFALTKAHEAGIVHRDLKPENLFLTRRDDDSPCVKVLDFGIAKLVEESKTHAETTRSFGTPVFMSPEQVQGEGTIGPAADLYALAQVVYHLLVGTPYWAKERGQGGAVYKLLLAICAGMKERASARAAELGVTLPPGFDAWFARAAALLPAERYPTASEFVAGLERAAITPRPAPHSKTIALDVATQSTVRAPRLKEPENKRTAPLGHGPVADPLPPELRARPKPARPGPTVVSASYDDQAVESAERAPLAEAAPSSELRPTLVAPPGGRRRALLVAALVAALAALALGAWRFFGQDEAKARKPAPAHSTIEARPGGCGALG